MRINQYDTVYFLGIGGIGMSALARWFHHKGMRVSGYDRTATELTRELEAEGMKIHYEDRLDAIPQEVIHNKEKTLVVFTPAIPQDHTEYNHLLNEGYTIRKRSEVLGLITKDYTTVAIAGTHGKTTTSSLVAHILKSAGKPMVGFLGGITANYGSNLIMQGEVGKDTIVVVEADEYDRSFHRLYPHIAIVTSADADHLDIYGDHAAVITSFRQFIDQIDKDGSLIIHDSVSDTLATDVKDVSVSTYSMSRGQFFAGNITPTSRGFFEFDLHGFEAEEHISLGVPGFHNIENAIAASVAAHRCGVDMNAIKAALHSFRGVKRRFEFIIRTDHSIYIDDYAHHPKEIEALLTSVRAMFPSRKVTAIFQPHLFTRTRDFAAEFADSLSLADEVILLDIYPARELPIEGVTSEIIYEHIRSGEKQLCMKNALMAVLADREIDVLVTLGAGDIDRFVEPIKKLIEERYAKV